MLWKKQKKIRVKDNRKGRTLVLNCFYVLQHQQDTARDLGTEHKIVILNCDQICKLLQFLNNYVRVSTTRHDSALQQQQAMRSETVCVSNFEFKCCLLCLLIQECTHPAFVIHDTSLCTATNRQTKQLQVFPIIATASFFTRIPHMCP